MIHHPEKIPTIPKIPDIVSGDGGFNLNTAKIPPISNPKPNDFNAIIISGFVKYSLIIFL